MGRPNAPVTEQKNPTVTRSPWWPGRGSGPTDPSLAVLFFLLTFSSITAGLLNEWIHWFTEAMNKKSMIHSLSLGLISEFLVLGSPTCPPYKEFIYLVSIPSFRWSAFLWGILRPRDSGWLFVARVGRETSAPCFPKFLSGSQLWLRHQNKGLLGGGKLGATSAPPAASRP